MGLNRIFRLSLSGSPATVVIGTGFIGNTDGRATAAAFNAPSGIAIDSGGMIYIADRASNVIRVASWAGGTVSRLAGSVTASGFVDGTGAAARFNTPVGLAVSLTSGQLYVCDTANNALRLVLPSGLTTTLFGASGVCGRVDGSAAVARLCSPTGVALSSSGDLFIADKTFHLIRTVAAGSSLLRTLAGSGNPGSANGLCLLSSFLNPRGIALPADGSSGRILVADSDNNMVRAVDVGAAPSWGAAAASPSPSSLPLPSASPSPSPQCTPVFAVSTLAGNGTGTFADGAALSSSLRNPFGVLLGLDRATIFFVDQLNYRLRSLSSGGMLSTVAGSGAAAYADGLGLNAFFYNPTGLAQNSSGHFFIADFGASRIRVVSPVGRVTTLPPAAAAVPATGVSVSLDGSTVYATIRGSHRVSVLPPGAPAWTVLAGSTSGTSGYLDALGQGALFKNPTSATCCTPDGNLLVADTSNNLVRAVASSTGLTVTVAGCLAGGFLDGPSHAACFRLPQQVAVDPSTSELYVADSGNNAVRFISLQGWVSTLAGASGEAGSQDGLGALLTTLSGPRFVSMGPPGSGSVIISDYSSNKLRLAVPQSTCAPQPTPAAAPTGLSLASGCLANVSTLAGSTLGTAGTALGIGSSALFSAPWGIALDAARGWLWVSDRTSHLVRPLVLATGAVTAGVGNALGQGFLDGVGTDSRLNSPAGLAVDPSSSWLYIAEWGNSRVRRVSPGSVLSTYAGTASGSSLGSAQQQAALIPTGLAMDASGTLWIANRDGHNILQMRAGGTVALAAGRGSPAFLDGPAAQAAFYFPSGLAVGASGSLLIADTFNSALRSLSSDGHVSTVAGGSARVGLVDGPAANCALNRPEAVAFDAASGGIFIVDSGNHALRLLLGGWLSTVAGGGGSATGGVPGYVSGLGTSALFNNPRSIAMNSGAGTLYITDASRKCNFIICFILFCRKCSRFSICITTA
jgi:DNA-binding beta-propeller fold protein YncE